MRLRSIRVPPTFSNATLISSAVSTPDFILCATVEASPLEPRKIRKELSVSNKSMIITRRITLRDVWELNLDMKSESV